MALQRSNSMDVLLDKLDKIPAEDLRWLYEPAKKKTKTLARRRSRGRPAKHHQYPEMVEVINHALSEEAIGAHAKRHNSHGYSCGKTVRELNAAVQKEIPELKNNVSDSTVRRQMLPAHAGRRAASHCHGNVDAKIAHRQNNLVENKNIDFHYTCSLINALLDASFSLFSQECLVLSCDTMNKVSKLFISIAVHERRGQIPIMRRRLF